MEGENGVMFTWKWLENGEGSLAFCCLESGGLERERKGGLLFYYLNGSVEWF